MDMIGFATSINGYAEAGGTAEVASLHKRFESEGHATMTLHELRIVLFGFQRAHYHQGGAWGDSDPVMDRMRALTGVIRERVAERGSGYDIWEGDITTLDVDVVVNAANTELRGGSGVDGAIHAAAGAKLREACRALPEASPGVRCPVGEARLTPGFNSTAPWIVHTVGPRWHDGGQGEAMKLASAYRASLTSAIAVGAQSIAFPALSTGVYGYPQFQAARVAVRTVDAWLSSYEGLMRHLLVAFDANAATALRSARTISP